jgi:fumarate reductase subunit D
MKALWVRLEPLLWLVFGAGMMVGTLLLPAYIVVLGLAAPLGLVSSTALSYERAHALASSSLGRLVLFALMALPVWKGAHHTRFLLIDLGRASDDALAATVLYGLAAVATSFALIAIFRL